MILATGAGMANCATVSSSAGLYGAYPNGQKVRSSYGQARQTLEVDLNVEDARKVASKSAAMYGWTIDVKTDGLYSGIAHWTPPGFSGPCTPDQSFAFYFVEEGKRQTGVTIVVDHLSFCALGTNSHVALQKELVATFNSVLATYE